MKRGTRCPEYDTDWARCHYIDGVYYILVNKDIQSRPDKVMFIVYKFENMGMFPYENPHGPSRRGEENAPLEYSIGYTDYTKEEFLVMKQLSKLYNGEEL